MIDLLLVSTVLIIGDSHSVGPFGWKLDENFRQAGFNVATYASCGSTASWWISTRSTTCGYYANDLSGQVTQSSSGPTPKLEHLLDDVRPDAVLVELGSNYVKNPNDDQVKNDIKDLVKIIKNRQAHCFWITPPDMRLYRSELSRLDRLIKEAVGSDCTIFESQSVTSYPSVGGDGVHYWFGAGAPIAREWADGVFEAFKKITY